MKKKKAEKKTYIHWFILAIFLILFGSLIVKAQKNLYTQKTTINSNTSKQKTLTPTILPSSKEGWNTFVYSDPKRGFTFELPSTWYIEQSETVENFAVIVLSYRENEKEYKLTINPTRIKEYRDPQIESIDEIKDYDGKSITIKTLYKEGVPFEVIGYFGDKESQKVFQTITMELPLINGEKYQAIFYEILSSMKINESN